MLSKNMTLIFQAGVLLVTFSGCKSTSTDSSFFGGGTQKSAADFKQANSVDNLKALFEELNKARLGNETSKAAALTRGLLPDEGRIRKALRDDAQPDSVKQIVTLLQGLTPTDEKSLARVFAADPANTEVQVHGATTEEISSYEKGSAAFNEFPGGAQRLASEILRPNMTFYEVELLKPGNDAGMKFHLFFWDGTQWTMLGPIWRASR